MKIKQPDPITHFCISMIKSGIRILGYAFLLINIEVGVGILVISEIIGILEEVL